MMQTVEELITVWFHEYERERIKPSSASCYYVHIYQYIIPKLGKYNVQDLTEAILQDYFNELCRNGRLKQEGGLSSKTVKDDKIILSGFLNYARRKGIISRNIVSDIRLPREYNREMRVLSLSEQRRLERTVRQSENSASFGIILCLYTGLRIGELCALRLKDIDLNRKLLHVRGTVQRVRNMNQEAKATSVIYGPPKSAASMRDIPIPDSIWPELWKHIVLQRTIYGAEAPLFSTKHGTHMEPRLYQRHFQKMTREAMITDVNFHALRHTFATRALETGMDYRTLSELLGHSNPSVTMDVYAHSLPEQKRKAINLLGKMYRE